MICNGSQFALSFIAAADACIDVHQSCVANFCQVVG